jgi:hypothetical protein
VSVGITCPYLASDTVDRIALLFEHAGVGVDVLTDR